MNLETLTADCVALLEKMIALPSFSREEKLTADLLFDFFAQYNLNPQRLHHNVWACSSNHIAGAKRILLNSHHDTVKPGNNWNTSPFTPIWKEYKLFGLGSNDAGASVVSLLATFIYLSKLPYALPYQLILAITAEEEVSGQNGIRALLPILGTIDLGIVGEPTQMHAATAEKGLIVLDCEASGHTGHAARDEGENAIYKALADIEWLRNFQFKSSPLLGDVKITITQIEAGTQHNVIPDRCSFVADIRTNDCYTNNEIIDILRQHLHSTISPRSYHLQSSHIDADHPFIKHLKAMNRQTFGSPTLSDQSVMPFDTVKIGPGMSERSHTPNEFIYRTEIQEAITLYITCLIDFNWET